MCRTQAWERLNDASYCGRLTTAQFYDLLISAGYGHQAAQAGAKQRGWARLTAGLTL